MLGSDADRDPAARFQLAARRDRTAAVERHPAVRLGLPGEEIHRRRADEARDEHACRVLVDLHRRADLLGAAGVHDDHPLRQRHRLDLVVGDVEAGRTEAAMELLNLEAHLHAKLGVEIRQRLVEQEHGRFAHDRSAHSDALALAAGKLARLALEQRAELENLARTLDPRIDVAPRQAADLESVRHVVEHAHVRVERVVLEDHGNVAIFRLELVHDPITDDDVAGRDLLESGNHAQQRGLTTTRRPNNDNELAVGNVEAHAVNHLVAQVALADVA